ncbi:DMT family transporter [Marinivivus vitaminiproducens]|uniref:DMT family transporter n=1 Tax=Marinivivus vitaminiproducens TaxID=3035935 RepID=UPI0027A6BDA6|nr:DMT family transporter [Geminicoccaceae bacterium SCSIO 64248]
MSLADWLMLLALSGLWGGSFVFTGVAVKELPPLTIVALRVGLAALILAAALRVLRVRLPVDRQIWATFLAAGVLNNVVPFCLIVWGQTHIASGLASILNATTPFWTVLIAHALTDDEKLSGNRLAGVVIGFLGVIVMIGPATLAGLGTDVVAQLACLAAALSYALAGVYGRRFKRLGVAPMTAATGQVVASTLLLAPIAIMVDRPWTLDLPGAATIGAVAGLAALSTALAYVLYFRILASAGATNLLLVTLLIPVSAIGLGVLVLGERLGPGHLVGLAVIGVGLAAIDGRLVAGRTR